MSTTDREEVEADAKEVGKLREDRGLGGNVHSATDDALAAAANAVASVIARAAAWGAEATTPDAADSPREAGAAKVVVEAVCGSNLLEVVSDLDCLDISIGGEGTKAGVATNRLPLMMGPAVS